VLDWCTVLAARGHSVTLATFDSPDVPPDWNGESGKPNVLWLPPARIPNGLVGPESVSNWQGFLAGSKDPVVHLHCPWTASNSQMSRAARKLGVPYLVSTHGMLNDWSMTQRGFKKRFFLWTIGRGYMGRAARLHYTATAERDQAQKWTPGPKAVVLPYLVDLSPFKTLPGPELARNAFAAIKNDKPKILFLSRLHEKKGVDILIDAADVMKRAGRSFQLLIAGPEDSEYATQLHQQVERLGLADSATFLGMVVGAEKISLYQAADVFVLPTLQENFGLVLIEALAAGTPVVTTRGTDIWQEIASAGQAVVENTREKMAEAIGKLLDDPAQAKALGNSGRAWALERFDTDNLAAEYEGLYAEIIEESKSRRGK
jgi:glycosyltransferase involved in cell wall biosynthesis